jgi:signal transduction histidine kinase
MATQSHRRQVFLFFAAVLLPCIALLALGLLLVVQERELGAARLDEERRRATRQLRQDLSTQLDRVALRQATALTDRPELLHSRTYDDSLVALVARFSKGRFFLPWELDELSGDSRVSLNQGEFGERVRQGERAEFASDNPARAIDLYGQALRVAQYPPQAAYARHSLARALNKAGREEDARREYVRLATAPPTLVDENGIAISLYALRQLLEADHVDTSLWQALQLSLSTDRWLAPPALYLLRDLVSRLSENVSHARLPEDAQDLVEDVSGKLARTEQALALKADFPTLGITAPDATPAHRENGWMPYGKSTWLVGVAPVGFGEDGVLVAVRSEPVLASLRTGISGPGGLGEASLTTAPAPDVEPLGSDFPGVFVRFDPTSVSSTGRAGIVRGWFYSAGLLLVVGVTLFGAYLLWRDVRREMRLAETRSRFVSAVSHELKTPLTAIRMFAETLYDDDPADSGTHREYLETIVNESERLTRLLNNVLDFSKIEGGQKAYRREPHSLEEIVRSTAGAMQYPLEQKRFALRLEIENDMPRAQVDRDAIEQALLNLLTNAMKYSGKNRDIELRMRSEGREAVIEVSDQGVGIEPAELSRIFERFYRVPSPENERISGTGLGLTLVQHIAQAHGGRVEVSSQPGNGSTFSLFLPLDRVVA